MNKKILLCCILGAVIIALSVGGVFIFANKECSHEYGAWQVITEADCTGGGRQERVCSKCGEKETSSVGIAGHNWQEATCKAPKTCARCGQTEGEPVAHSFTKEEVTDDARISEATCSSGSIYHKSCEFCGKISESDEDVFEHNDKLEHDFSKEEAKAEALCSAATCVAKAKYYKSCAACGAICSSDKDVFESGAALGHDHKVTSTQAATCEKAKKVTYACTRCANTYTNDVGSPLGHEFEEIVISNGARISAATCVAKAKYHKTCSVCGKSSCGDSCTNADHIFESVTTANHAFTREIVSDSTLCSVATCTQAAKYYKTCTWCNEHSTADNDTFENGDPIAHTYDKTIASENARISDADCTHAARYYKSCECGAVSASEEDAFENGDALGHDHKVTSTTDATCEQAATKTYVCSRCSDTHTDIVGDPLDHDLDTEAEPNYNETDDQSKPCEYVKVYKCKTCKKEVETDVTYIHEYSAKITNEATCKEKGEKTLTCARCGDVQTEDIEIDTINGHNWGDGVTDDSGVTTYSCKTCSTTKTAMVYSDNKAENVSTDRLKDNEISIKGDGVSASFNVSESAADNIKDNSESVNFSIGTVDKDTLTGVDAEQLEKVGDNTIYDFGLTDGEGKSVTFGDANDENAVITVTIPYDLDDDEDVNSIVIWYINESGDLEPIEATYSNGFVTFSTSHFSYYTVTRLTPRERCDAFGHVWSDKLEVIEGDCLTDSYKLAKCVRCHEIERRNVEKASGHTYPEQGTVPPATCTASGRTTFKCEKCDHYYETLIPAKGHSYDVTEEKAATCSIVGYQIYKCDNCDSGYTKYTAKIAHETGESIIAPTCTEAGYTLHSCANCDYSYKDNYVPALGHEYDYEDEQNTIWSWNGLTLENAALRGGISASVTFCCTREGCEHRVENLTAVISFKVKYGVCSGYLKVTVTASVAFEDGVRSNEQEFVRGAENHNFSASKHDQTNHWLECVCGEKSNIEKHAFGTPEVTKQATCTERGKQVYTCSCGFEKEEVIPATEHSYKDGVCEICGSGAFYKNLVESYKNNCTYYFTIENLRLSGVPDFEQVDVIWLTIYIENGEVKGEGELNLRIRNDTLKCKAVIEDGYLYALASNGGMDWNLCMPVDTLIDALIGEIAGSNGQGVSQALAYIYKTVLSPVINTYAPSVKVEESDLERLFNLAFTREQAQNGYKLTLDFDKLSALNKALYEKPVAEIIDMFFGEGAFDGIEKTLISICDVTVNQAAETLISAGVSSEVLSGYLEFIYGEPVSLEEWLDRYGALTPEELLPMPGSYSSYKEFITDMAKLAKQYSLYEFIKGDNEYARYAMEAVNDALSYVAPSVSLNFYTGENGAFNKFELELNEFAGGLDAKLSVTCSDKKPEFILSDMTGEIKNDFAAPESVGKLTADECWWGGNYGYSVLFGEEYYSLQDGIEIYAHCYGEPIFYEICSDCGDWNYYNTCLSFGCKYEFSFAITEDGVMFLMIGETALAKLTPTDSGVKVEYADGTVKEIGGVLPPVSENENEDEHYEYHEHLDYYCDLALAFLNDCDMSSVKDYAHAYSYRSNYFAYYYYNTKTGEYAHESQHSFVRSYALANGAGSSCEDGVLVTYTCENCGYSYGYEDNWHPSTESKVIDLKDEGFCGVNLTQHYCTLCGMIESSNFYPYDSENACVFEYSGETEQGYYIYTCKECGGKFYAAREVGEKDEYCDCTVSRYYVFECKGKVYRALDHKYTTESHNWQYEFELYGETCEDGYWVIRTCADCGNTEEYEYSGHFYASEGVGVRVEGFCGDGVDLTKFTCSICQYEHYEHWRDECNFEYTGEWTEGGNPIYTCTKCGGSWYYHQEQGEKNENCEIVINDYLVYVTGENEYKLPTSIHSYVSHNLKYEFVLNGETCEQGYTVIATCKDCGNVVREEQGNTHRTYCIFDLSDCEGAWCAEHEVYVYSCACGTEHYLSSSLLGTCFDCGLSVIEEQTVCDLVDCIVNKKWHVTVSYNGEELYDLSYDFNYSDHSYGSMQLGTDEDGDDYIGYTCSKCGDLKASTILKNTVLSFDSGSYEFEFTAEDEKNYYVFLFDSDAYFSVNIFDAESGELVYERYNGWRLWVELDGGEYIVRVWSESGVQKTGLVILPFKGLSDGIDENGARCSHNYQTSYVLLSGNSCENGVIEWTTCTRCGVSYKLALTRGHQLRYQEVDLSDYGACKGSYIYGEFCSCFELVDSLGVKFGGCNTDYSFNSYQEGANLKSEEKCYCVECGLSFQAFCTAFDVGNCQMCRMYTITVKVGDKLIASYDYHDYYENHDYEVSYEFLTEQQNCESGVTFIYTCKTCGYSYRGGDRYMHEEQILIESIDLSDYVYGCVCGGYVNVYSCPCGANTFVNINNVHCDFDGVDYYDDECEGWIEGDVIIEDYQFNSSYWAKAYCYGYVRTCAVTNPEVCGFKIRYIEYWLKAENECKLYRYVTYQFGHDDELGSFNCLREITYKTSAALQWHNYGEGVYTDENGVQAWVYTCTKCGSTYTERNYTDEEGRKVSEQSAINSLKNEFNKSCLIVSYNVLDEDDRLIEEFESRTYVDCYGNEHVDYERTYGYVYYNSGRYVSYEKVTGDDYWYNYEYSYSFPDAVGEGRCESTVVYTNSYGENKTSTEYCCTLYYNESSVIVPTCTQVGQIEMVCVVCGFKEIRELEPNGHDFVLKEDGIYSCSRCGLENEVGASGAVVLEDLTSAHGNGVNYVAGYYIRNGAKFDYYVSIIVGGIEEYVLTGVDFSEVEGLTAVAFSKEQVADLAKAALTDNGYDENDLYEVRLSFVPEGAASSLDYAITFTTPVEE